MIVLSKGTDIIGLAMAAGMLNDKYGNNETIFELSNKVQLNHQICIKPDLQYLVHPGGTDALLKIATVGMVRWGIEF